MNMMNKTYIHFVLILCMAFFSGCVNVEEFEEPAQKVTKIFYADMENQPGTKTVLGEKDAEGFRTIFWIPEDSIGVAPINTSESSFDCFVNQKTELSNRAVFEGKTAVAQEYVAVYPYDWGTSIWDNTVYLTLDPVQTYVEGTFEQGAFPMLARTSDTDEGVLKFLNLCGILEINLKGTDKVESITFTSDNNVSGSFSVSLDYETEPEMVAVRNSNIVTLKSAEGVQLDESAPTPFYLVLPPAEYQSFTLCIRTVDGKLMFKQSKNPLTITRSRLTAAGALEYVESVSFDLSLRGTSNCYVVPLMGKYKFNATVIGNGASGIIPDANFHTTDPTISPSSVEVLWEAKGANEKAELGELLSDVTLTDDGYVEFLSTGVEGNALVAAKDADGTILWSWHLWFVGDLSEEIYQTVDGETTVMLDRNLAAVKKDESDQRNSAGAYYQWGRKDPFIHSCFTQESLMTTPQVSVTKPDVMLINGYAFGSDYKQDWMIPVHKLLWQPRVKTIYDPCPVGYRVSSMSPLEALSSDYSKNESGFMVPYDGENTAWFPQTGFYTGGHNRKANDGASYLWTSEYNKYLDCRDESMTIGNYYRSVCAMPVRCMKDEGYIDIALPYLTEPGIHTITAESATIAFDILNEGNSDVFEAGIIYGTAPELSLENGNKVIADEGYKIEITGLKEGTKYYVVAYARNSEGASYSKEIAFYTAQANTTMLSRYATANCYIVSESGTYAFDASVKGNSARSVGLPVSAEVLWEIEHHIAALPGTVIQSVELNDNLVTFVATGIEGNALIAVKDSEDVILWSWHIWVTDQPDELSYVNGLGKFSVLDRNLGATRADRGVGDEWNHASGLLYEWGRKDPFADDCYEWYNKNMTIQESVESPTVYAARNSPWTSEWNDNLWSSAKTIYDPCPIGYKVISKDAWAGFTITGDNVSSVEDINAFGKFDYGWNLYVDDQQTTWYPADPHIGYMGHFEYHTAQGYCWCSTPSTIMTFTNSLVKFESTMSYQAFPVRCMKEDVTKVLLNTTPATNITKSSADIHGSFENHGSTYIFELGLVWSSTDKVPDVNSNKVSVDVRDGDFSHSLTGLVPGTTYYVRSYAVGNNTVYYGRTVSFTTQTSAGNENIPEGDEYEW